MSLSRLGAIFIALLLACISMESHSSYLDTIQKRGTLIVGVKSDYPPWGMVNSDGELVGLEADLARNIAERLNVKLRLVAVTSANRLQKVEGGSIDLVIATMGDTVKRRQLAGLLEPNYYASGVSVLLHKTNSAQSWADLRGRPICLTQGAYYNRALVERYLIKPIVYKGTRDSALGLESGNCVGWAYDDLALAPLLEKDPNRWAGYWMPLPSILVSPWAVAVKSELKGKPWGQFVSDIIIDWHKTGFLIERETAWGLPSSSYLQGQKALWSSSLCSRKENGDLPPSCLDQNLLRESGQVDKALGNGLALALYQQGIDFPPLYDEFSRARLIEGLGWTLLLSFTAILGSLLFGVLFGFILTRLGRPWRYFLETLLSITYMTPPLLNLYLLMFGIGGWLALKYNFALDAFWVAAVVFSLYAGGSNTVIFSHALDWMKQNCPDKTSIASQLSGALVRGYGGLVANSVNIVKAVGMASAIAVPEIIFSGSAIVAEFGTTAEIMNVLVIFYLVLVSMIVMLLDKTKEWVTRGHQ